MRKSILLGLALLCSSCTAYQQEYDCPPGKGVGCKSLTEIEAMIKVKDEGANEFVFSDDVQTSRKSCCKPVIRQKSKASGEAPIVKRVWVDSYTTEVGHRVEGHFLYFVLNDGEWILKS